LKSFRKKSFQSGTHGIGERLCFHGRLYHKYPNVIKHMSFLMRRDITGSSHVSPIVVPATTPIEFSYFGKIKCPPIEFYRNYEKRRIVPWI
jgi:hypothetical protein